MTLDYTKMFLIVTEEAVVKGHFDFTEISLRKGRFFIARGANRNLTCKKQMPLGICFFNINLFSGLRWDSGLRP